MCKKKQFKYCPSEIDECMKNVIYFLEDHLKHPWKTIACCCGHGKYPMTILVRNLENFNVIDMISGKIIPRKKNFYKRDGKRIYYIPEVCNAK